MERASASIVIMDDNTDFLEVAEVFLAEEGYRVFACAESGHALRLIKQERPDLVILDVRMPTLGGFGLLYRLSEDERTRDIPVLICSALPPAEVAAWQDLFVTSRVKTLPKPLDWSIFVTQVGLQLTASSPGPGTGIGLSRGGDEVTPSPRGGDRAGV